MKFQSDIDIDFGDRDKALTYIKHIPASMFRNDVLSKHASGVYVTNIPTDPFGGFASIDYKTAEDRGYVKLDFLNFNLYEQIESESHLVELMMREPTWENLYNRDIASQLTHIGRHYELVNQMPERIDSIPRLAMFLSVIRPAKRHLIGKPWKEVALTIWEKPNDDSYYFKKSHAIAYATLVAVHMNLLEDQATAEASELK